MHNTFRLGFGVSFSDNRKSKIENGRGFLQSSSRSRCAGRGPTRSRPGKIFRTGFLDNSTASGSPVLSEAFRQELSKLGWIEGKNFAIEYRFANSYPLSKS